MAIWIVLPILTLTALSSVITLFTIPARLFCIFLSLRRKELSLPIGASDIFKQ